MKVYVYEKLINNDKSFVDFNNVYEVLDKKISYVSKTGTLFTLENLNDSSVKVNLVKMVSKDKFEVFATTKITQLKSQDIELPMTDDRALLLNFSLNEKE